MKDTGTAGRGSRRICPGSALLIGVYRKIDATVFFPDSAVFCSEYNGVL